MERKQKEKAGAQALQIILTKWREGTLPEILEDWKWILSYSKRYKGTIAFYIVLGLFGTSLGLVNSVAGKYMIDIITGYKTDMLGMLIAVMAASILFDLVFGNLISRILTRLSIDIGNDIQADIFDRIVDADWLSLNRFAKGDVLNRFNADIGTVSNNAISWLPTVIIAIYRFVATFLLILNYDPVMAFLALAGGPFLFFFSHFLISNQREYGKKMKEMSSKLTDFEVETFYNLDTIKAFGASVSYSKKMRWWQAQFKEISLKYNLFSIWTGIGMSLLGAVLQYTAFGYCLFRLWTGDITYGTMTLFLQQRSSLSAAFHSLISIIPAFLNSSVSAHRIRELVELPREIHIPESAQMDAYMQEGFAVCMNKADFVYTEGTPVLSGADFKACPGEIVALVGPSGEGKTTIIRLLLGLVHPTKGTVFLEASDGRRIPVNAETRHLFAYVPQNCPLLAATIAEHLRLVKEDATEEEIIEALQIACAWDFVKKLPKTVDADLGEGGKNLSRGQAQRVSIAGAVLRDAPVLLLDEAFSALDMAMQEQIFDNILKSRPNKTIILTTHRPGILRSCRRVYRVMGTGIKEEGWAFDREIACVGGEDAI